MPHDPIKELGQSKQCWDTLRGVVNLLIRLYPLLAFLGCLAVLCAAAYLWPSSADTCSLQTTLQWLLFL